MKKSETKVLLKCAEELSELVTRILQHCNKQKDYSSHIKEEIEDVKIQLKIINDLMESQ
jgi:NTP pyrophosphatase (non-canonical NTP hydrolase)